MTGKPADGEAILIVGDDVLAQRVARSLPRPARPTCESIAPADADNDAGCWKPGSYGPRDPDALRGRRAQPRSRAARPDAQSADRVVLRQFGTKIGRKIEQNLPDSTVLSLAAHSAATYAGAALDPGCFFALRFPGRASTASSSASRATAADARRRARPDGRRGRRAPEPADRRRRDRATNLRRGALIDGPDAIVAFGPVRERRTGARRRDGAARATAGRWRRCSKRCAHQPDLAHDRCSARSRSSRSRSRSSGCSAPRRGRAPPSTSPQTMTSSGFGDTRVVRAGLAGNRRGDAVHDRRHGVHQHLDRLRQRRDHARAVDGVARPAAHSRARSRRRLRRRPDRQRGREFVDRGRQTRRRHRLAIPIRPSCGARVRAASTC